MTHVRYSSQLREADMNRMPQLSILFGLCLTACDMMSCYANGPVNASSAIKSEDFGAHGSPSGRRT